MTTYVRDRKTDIHIHTDIHTLSLNAIDRLYYVYGDISWFLVNKTPLCSQLRNKLIDDHLVSKNVVPRSYDCDQYRMYWKDEELDLEETTYLISQRVSSSADQIVIKKPSKLYVN